jgi:hypothetical protein
MNRPSCAVLLALIALPFIVLAKGDGRSFVIEGTVIAARAIDSSLDFSIKGDLLVTECIRGKCATTPWETRSDIELRVSQRDTFFAMTPDRRGGSIQEPEKLAHIVERAAEHGQRIRLELRNPKISFDAGGKVRQVEAQIVRITDYDLR